MFAKFRLILYKSRYVEKDPRLCEPILDGLLRIWAITNASKEVLFINEVRPAAAKNMPAGLQISGLRIRYE